MQRVKDRKTCRVFKSTSTNDRLEQVSGAEINSRLSAVSHHATPLRNWKNSHCICLTITCALHNITAASVCTLNGCKSLSKWGKLNVGGAVEAAVCLMPQR